MRLLFIIDKLATGGRERRMLELIKELSKDSRYTITIVLMDEHIGYANVFDYNIEVKYLIRKTKKDFSLFAKFYQLCKQYKPDVIHSWSSMSSIYALPTIILQRIRFFNNAINDAPPKVKLFSSEGFRSLFTFAFSDIIFANSKAGIKSYNPPIKKTVCIYNGFDFKRVSSLEDPYIIRAKFDIRTKYVVGMVGSFTKFKDYKTYVNAAQKILSQRRDVTFLAIGDGPLLNEIKESVSVDNKELIKFLGGQTNVESIVNIFDIGVLSTYSEGLPNAILEYMALSKPAVSVNEGGTKELVVEGITGFLVKPLSPNELSAKIEVLLNDNKLMIQMGNAGYNRIKELFSLDKMVKSYAEQYAQIVMF